METFPKRVDVAIIGGGAIGLCCAYYLNRLGREVAVLERDTLHSGCSGENAGLIVPSHIEPLANPEVLSQGLRWLFRPGSPFRIKPRLDPALFSWLLAFRKACNPKRMEANIPTLHQLLQASRALFEELSEDRSLNFRLHRNGLLMLHHSSAGEAHHLQMAKLAAECGVPVEILNRKALFQKEPLAPPQSSGGIYFPQDAHLNPGAFLNALAKCLRQKDAHLLEATSVTGFQTKGNRITGIRTSSGDLEVDQVILAAGSWSPKIATSLNLKLPIQAGKGYTLTVPTDRALPRIPMLLAEARVSITPLQGALRIGGTLELAGLDPAISMSRTTQLQATARAYLGDAAPQSWPANAFWSGFRPCTPDGLPLLGWSKTYPNLAIASGHAMLGMSLAPISGKLIAQMMDGQPTQVPLDRLAPHRFY